MTETYTLFKNSPIPGGTYTDIAEFVADKEAGIVTITTACKWSRHTADELDNGSDLFESRPTPTIVARQVYRSLLNQGYTATTRKFDLIGMFHR